MKAKRSIFWFMALLLVLSSCEKEIEFKGKELDNMMTMHSEISSNSTIITCYVGKTQFFLSKEKDFTLEGEQLLYRVNGGDWMDMDRREDLDEYSRSNAYSAYCKMNAGDVVEFELRHADYETVRARQVVPSELSFELGEVEDLGNKYAMKLDFDNYEGSGDYLRIGVCYHISVMDYSTEVNYMFGTSDKRVLVDYRHLNNQSTEGIEVAYEEIFLPISEVREGISLDIELFKNYYGNLFSPSDTKRTLAWVEVEANVYTEAGYKYNRDLKLYRGSGNPFAENVQIYSNIEGGLGIFYIYSKGERDAFYTW